MPTEKKKLKKATKFLPLSVPQDQKKTLKSPAACNTPAPTCTGCPLGKLGILWTKMPTNVLSLNLLTSGGCGSTRPRRKRESS